MNLTKKIAAIALAAIAAIAAIAVLPGCSDGNGGGEDAGNLAKGEVTTRRLKELLSDKFPDSEIDGDGDLLVKRDGTNAYVFVEDKKVLLKFFTRWNAASTISEARAVGLANKWNCDKVFTVASHEDGKFILRYYMSYEGGINAANFNDSLEWFFSLSRAFGETLSSNNAI